MLKYFLLHPDEQFFFGFMNVKNGTHLKLNHQFSLNDGEKVN